MNPLDLLILALATWRLAYLLTKEDAPFQIMARIRQRTTFGGLLTCVYCASIWCAAGLYALWVLLPALHWIALILAVSGAALMLAKYTGMDYSP